MGYYDQNRSADNVAVRTQGFPGPGLNSVGEFQQSGRPYVVQAVLAGAHANGDATEAFDANTNVKDDDTTITFPYITKKIVINNTSGAVMQVYFCSLLVPAEDLAGADLNGADPQVVLDPAPTGRGNKITTAELNAYHDNSDARPSSAVLDNGHYYTIADDTSLELNVKCRRVYLAGTGTDDFCVAAELTNIVHPYNCDLRGIDGISGGTAGSVTE